MGGNPFSLGAIWPLPSPSAIPEHNTSMDSNHNARESGSSSCNNNNNGGDTNMLLNNQYHSNTLGNGSHPNQSSSDDKDEQVIPYPNAMARFKPTTTITTTTSTTTTGDLPTPTTRRAPSLQRLPLIFDAPNGQDNVYPLAHTPTPSRLQHIPFHCQATQGVLEESVLKDGSLAVQVTMQRRTNQSPRKRLVSWFSSEEDWDNVTRSSKRTETVSSLSSQKRNNKAQIQDDKEDQHMASFMPSSSSSSSSSPSSVAMSGCATTTNPSPLATDVATTTTTNTMENLGVMDSPNSALPSPSLSPVSALATDDDLWPTPSNSSPSNMEETIPSDMIHSTTTTISTTAEETNNIIDAHSTTTTYTNNALIPSHLLYTNNILDTYTQLPNDNVRQYFLLHLLRRSNMNTLRLAHSAINDVLRTDIIGRLPCHLQHRILSFLDVRMLCRCLGVSQQWRRIIDGDAELWRYKIEQAGYQITQEEHVQQQHDEMMNRGAYGYKMIYQRHLRIHLNWRHNRAHRMQLPGHSIYVVTCLQFDEDKIITASNDHTINLYDIRTGQLIRTFYGHEGGVWALQYVGNTLVTGATDRTIRVWDIDTGQCRHVFHGHSGTVRCLTIVMPIKNPNTGIYEPQRPLIVSGSRDHSVRVWDLPQSTNITATTTTCLQHEDATMKNENHRGRSRNKDTRASAMDRLSKYMPQDESAQPIVPDMTDLPMRSTTTTDKTIHVHVLLGHREAVRALAAHGNTLVSGSYDGSVRIWHLEQGRCIHQLLGHSSKVYSVAIDAKRNRCISGSMDSFVRIWNMETGVCEHVLGGHTALVGLLGLSASHLVSAAADRSLRVWSPDTGDRQHVLLGHEGPITSFQHDDHKVISGSDGGIKMWDIKTGKLMHNLVDNVSSVWRVAFDERRCIAAVKGEDDVTRLEIFDYDVY